MIFRGRLTMQDWKTEEQTRSKANVNYWKMHDQESDK